MSLARLYPRCVRGASVASATVDDLGTSSCAGRSARLYWAIMAVDSNLFQKFGRVVEAGKTIFREGEEGDQMYIIQSGKVRISKNIGGKEHVLAILEKGDFFGEMAIVNRVKRTATVTAVDKVELLAFTREGFLSMITKNAKIALNVIDKLCQRLQNANVQIQHLVKKNAKGLVALNLYYAFQAAGWERATIPYDRTVDETSLSLQVAMETVKAYLDSFQQAGMLRIEGNSIILTDRAKLDAIAEHFGLRQ